MSYSLKPTIDDFRDFRKNIYSGRVIVTSEKEIRSILKRYSEFNISHVFFSLGFACYVLPVLKHWRKLEKQIRGGVPSHWIHHLQDCKSLLACAKQMDLSKDDETERRLLLLASAEIGCVATYQYVWLKQEEHKVSAPSDSCRADFVDAYLASPFGSPIAKMAVTSFTDMGDNAEEIMRRSLRVLRHAGMATVRHIFSLVPNKDHPEYMTWLFEAFAHMGWTVGYEPEEIPDNVWPNDDMPLHLSGYKEIPSRVREVILVMRRMRFAETEEVAAWCNTVLLVPGWRRHMYTWGLYADLIDSVGKFLY
jgi:hypothetical protein